MWIRVLIFVSIGIGLGFSYFGRTFESTSILIIKDPLYDCGFHCMADFSQINYDKGIMLELLQTDSFIQLIISETELEEKTYFDVFERTIVQVRNSIEINVVEPDVIEFKATWNDQYTADQLADSALRQFLMWKVNSHLRAVSYTHLTLPTKA